MNEDQSQKDSQRPKRNFNAEEKRKYCIAWEKSGMKQADFCKTHEISKSALYKWVKEFKKENDDLGFSPLIVKKQPTAKQAKIVQLNICFPNQMQLNMAMPEHCLVSFIQELGYAIAVIR